MQLPHWICGFLVLAANCSLADVIYENQFQAAPGTSYLEWTSSEIRYSSEASPPGAGNLAAPPVTVVKTPSDARILGEFGGPEIGRLGDPGYNRTRVEQTIRLTLSKLPPHAALRITMDVCILKSWDGNSRAYGPDRWRLEVAGGQLLLDTTFSNNPKVQVDGSTQDYPVRGSNPGAGAQSENTYGYSGFFKDHTYRLSFTFVHSAADIQLLMRSSLFEGKGTKDESWALAAVKLETAELPEVDAPK